MAVALCKAEDVTDLGLQEEGEEQQQNKKYPSHWMAVCDLTLIFHEIYFSIDATMWDGWGPQAGQEEDSDKKIHSQGINTV